MSVSIVGIDDPQAMQRAVTMLAGGGLVALPTDTVYGVAADPWNVNALKAIYDAKGRPLDKAIPILLADAQDASRVAVEVSARGQVLARSFWPGPLTLVVPKQPTLSDLVSALPTIGLRLPDHDATRAIIRKAGGALAVTSANRSGELDSLTADAAADALGDALGLVLDGGRCPGGQPSTIVDVSDDTLQVLREGPISVESIQAALAQAEH